jgi:hypothetical protein
MTAKPKPRRRKGNLETNTAPDALPDDLRRRDQRQTSPDSLPPRDEARDSSDYEREIDRLDAAARGLTA